MSETVAVIDPVPTFRAGLAVVLDRGGFHVVESEGSGVRVPEGRIDVAVVTVRCPDTRIIHTLLADAPGLVLVAVLVSPSPEDFRAALRAGARAAAAWDSTPEDIVAVVRAAMAGQTLLPAPIVAALVESSVEAPELGDVGESETRWLQALARGTSVVRLARTEGYSQREIFRRLADLYARMGVRNRHEAIALAGRWGLLKPAADVGAATHGAAVLQLR